MTLYILALDAVDARLVEEFDCEHLKLEEHTEMTTISSESRKNPYTMEVWPSVATGVRPETHGVEGSDTSSWDNPVVDLLSSMSGILSERNRSRLGRLATKITGAEFTSGSVEVESIFDTENRVVREWPGITDSRELIQVWEWVKQADEGSISEQEFERYVMGMCGAQFGWISEMDNHTVDLAATHVHTVDAFGHAYASEPEKLKKYYKRLDSYVEEFIESIDGEILIVSDHGMQVSWKDDSPGEHSWHAFSATTIDQPPTHVLDVKEWIEERIRTSIREENSVDMPTETLERLGYLE